jgi:membrane fusion protein (multidrug efflux system)
MAKRLIIAAILLGLVVAGIVGFNLFRDRMISEFFAGRTPPPVAVSVTVAEPTVWTPGLEAVGTALAAQGVDLSVEAAGVVREILFAPNDHVTAGDQLVQIDDRMEQADLAAAIAAQELAETELARSRTLRERGVSTDNTLDTAEATATEARSRVQRLRAVLEQKQSVAPFNGIIGIPRIEAGQYVTPGTVYATLQDLDYMRVDFSLPEQESGIVKIGMPVTMSSEVGGVTARGEIVGIEPRIDPNSRLVTVRADVENPGGRITPGQFMRVRVELPPEEGVIALPQTTVSSTLYGDSVYIVRPAKAEGEPERVEQVFGTLGRRAESVIELVKGGEPGDRVVNAGQNRLSSNAAVTIDNEVAPVRSVEPAPGEQAAAEAEPAAEAEAAAEPDAAADPGKAGEAPAPAATE